MPTDTGYMTLDYCWERLAELDSRWDIFYFPIDIDRELHLKRLSERLGRVLETDWEKVGAFKDQESAVEPMDYSWVYELPFVKQYYDPL
jgi:hypothetical protein